MRNVVKQILSWMNKNGHPKKKNVKERNSIKYIRKLYKQNKLNEEEINNLEKVNGWVWNNSEKNKNIFYDNFEKLRSFIETNGQLPEITSDKKLYNWCQEIKRKYKKGDLHQTRIQKFKQLEFWIFNKSEKYELMKKEYVEYFRKYNKLPDKNNEKKLYFWAQYHNYKININNF